MVVCCLVLECSSIVRSVRAVHPDAYWDMKCCRDASRVLKCLDCCNSIALLRLLRFLLVYFAEDGSTYQTFTRICVSTILVHSFKERSRRSILLFRRCDSKTAFGTLRMVPSLRCCTFNSLSSSCRRSLAISPHFFEISCRLLLSLSFEEFMYSFMLVVAASSEATLSFVATVSADRRPSYTCLQDCVILKPSSMSCRILQAAPKASNPDILLKEDQTCEGDTAEVAIVDAEITTAGQGGCSRQPQCALPGTRLPPRTLQYASIISLAP